MLLDCHLLGRRPIRVATKVVGPSGGNVVLGLPPLISAGDPVMVGTDWKKTMGVAICSHVAEFLHLGASALVITCGSPGIWVTVFVGD